MTSTDRLVAGVIAVLFVFAARLYVMYAAFGAMIVCVALATTMEVMMATTVAIRMTPGRENFWIRIVIAFVLFWFSFVWISFVWGFFVLIPVGSWAIAPGGVPAKTSTTRTSSAR